jgi:uncharacterized protein
VVSETDHLLAGLEALYRDVDALFEHARCDSSSECCRFGITGREPQITSIELALLERALARTGGRVPSPKRRALPLTTDPKRERPCPLLMRSGGCAVYAERPLGCRTFFCRRAEQPYPPSRAELRAIVQRLGALAARHAPSGDRPRGLLGALSG